MIEGSGPYADAARSLLAEHDVIVWKWRSGSSGVAYTSTETKRVIECPKPTGAVSFGILAHEVGHQVLHRGNGSYPRWREEIEAEQFALDAFDRLDVPNRQRYLKNASKHVARATTRVLDRRPSLATIEEIQGALPGWLRDSDRSQILDAATVAERARNS